MVRAAMFQPPKREATPDTEPMVDRDKAVSHLQAMIRCRTISAPELRDEGEFEKFRKLLPARNFLPVPVSRLQFIIANLTG